MQNSDKVLKLLNKDSGKDDHFKVVGLKLVDPDSDSDEDTLGSNEAVKLLGGSQVGTPLPSAELVKELLQSGTALNSDANSQVPLIASDQSSLQQSPTLVQPEIAQQPIQPQQPMEAQQLLQQALLQQEQKQPQHTLNNILPQVSSLTAPISSNDKSISQLVKSQDDSTDSDLSVQPVVLNPSLLSQAILGTGKFNQEQAVKPENLQPLGNALQTSSVPLGALSTLPVQDSVLTNKKAPSQESGQLTSSFEAASLPVADLGASKEAQFQSPIALPNLKFPAQLGNPARKTNWFGLMPETLANKKSPFDEYKYDLHDKEGNRRDFLLFQILPVRYIFKVTRPSFYRGFFKMVPYS